MVRASRTLSICVFVLAILFTISADAALVKKSNSGLCHPPLSSKGAKGPDEWLPPAARCGYVARFFRIVKKYDL